MQKRRMGQHGLEVPVLTLGTMTFGLQVDEAGFKEILDQAEAYGLTFLDTADAYPLGGTLKRLARPSASLTAGCTDEATGRDCKSRPNALHQRARARMDGDCHDNTSWSPSIKVCSDSKPTMSICFRRTGLTPIPQSKKPYAHLKTFSAQARRAISAAQTILPGAWLTP